MQPYLRSEFTVSVWLKVTDAAVSFLRKKISQGVVCYDFGLAAVTWGEHDDPPQPTTERHEGIREKMCIRHHLVTTEDGSSDRVSGAHVVFCLA